MKHCNPVYTVLTHHQSSSFKAALLEVCMMESSRLRWYITEQFLSELRDTSAVKLYFSVLGAMFYSCLKRFQHKKCVDIILQWFVQGFIQTNNESWGWTTAHLPNWCCWEIFGVQLLNKMTASSYTYCWRKSREMYVWNIENKIRLYCIDDSSFLMHL